MKLYQKRYPSRKEDARMTSYQKLYPSLLVLLALLLAACGGQPAAQPKAANEAAPTTAPAAATEASAAEDAETEERDEGTESEATIPDDDTAEETRGTLRVAYAVWYGGAETMDPADYTLFWDAMPLVYDTLTRPDENWQPVPELATDWEPNEDATIWTFTLRDDVTFHDGKPFTSADVAYTFEHILDPEKTSIIASVFQIIEQVETPDDQTAIFHLAQSHADFPSLLMGLETSIIPANSGDTIGATGIGTGPFKLETLDPTGTTRLVAYDAYWQGNPALAAIELIGIPEAGARLQALQAGQIDLILQITPQEAQQFAASDTITVEEFRGNSWTGFGMRTDIPPFDDVRVRKAIRLVADRQQLLDLTYGGQGTVVCDTPVLSESSYYWNGECPQDIAQAKALLAEAGYADGLDVTLYTSNVLGHFIPMAEVYQQQAAAAGINVTIEQVPAAGFWSDTWGIEPLFVDIENQYPADLALSMFYSPDSIYNATHMESEELMEAVQNARAEMDPIKRKAQYQSIQEWLFEESGLFIPYSLNDIQVYAKNVTGVPTVGRYYKQWHEVSKTE